MDCAIKCSAGIFRDWAARCLKQSNLKMAKFANPKFSKYRVPRFQDIPPIEVVLVDRKDLQPAGAGEIPLMALAPSIGNAICDASGVRSACAADDSGRNRESLIVRIRAFKLFFLPNDTLSLRLRYTTRAIYRRLAHMKRILCTISILGLAAAAAWSQQPPAKTAKSAPPKSSVLNWSLRQKQLPGDITTPVPLRCFA